ncbi:MAG: hypothetical protein P8I55_01675 [Crocinitomix sp.]|nr:hypothetical protein [Crocinitomix sp.]
MKKFILLMMVGATVALTSCGGEEPAVEEVIETTDDVNNMLNNLMEQGLNEVVSEGMEQLGDSTSALNGMMDTLKDVIEDNKDVIEEKVQQGIDALNESF